MMKVDIVELVEVNRKNLMEISKTTCNLVHLVFVKIKRDFVLAITKLMVKKEVGVNIHGETCLVNIRTKKVL